MEWTTPDGIKLCQSEVVEGNKGSFARLHNVTRADYVIFARAAIVDAGFLVKTFLGVLYRVCRREQLMLKSEDAVILIVSLTYPDASTSPDMVEYGQRLRPLLVKYGAQRIYSGRVLASQSDDPQTIHLTRFEDKAQFEAMQADPEFLAMEDLRQKAMRNIRFYVTEENVMFLD